MFWNFSQKIGISSKVVKKYNRLCSEVDPVCVPAMLPLLSFLEWEQQGIVSFIESLWQEGLGTETFRIFAFEKPRDAFQSTGGRDKDRFFVA